MADNSNSKKGTSNYIRFTSVGIQMAGTIAFFSWLGNYLDNKYKCETPWWTISLSLFGVLVSLYLVIKEVIKIGKEGEK